MTTFVFLDNFDKGLRDLREHNPNLAEQSLSQALKILSASPNSSHFNKEKATCFHTMAEIYLTRASQQVDDDGFCEMMVKGIALFEAERIYKYGSYKEDKEINTAILEAEVKFGERVFGPSGVERFKEMSDRRILNRKKMEELRSKVTNEYFPTLAKIPDWNSEDEEERCHEIESMYKKIYDDMKCLLVDILFHCSQIAGPAPCNFSIIGLGSTSRKEVTPYSDLEFSILVDDNSKTPSPEQRQYFRFLTYFIQIQIIKLGETILPSVGISSLNDFYSKNKEDDWFYDDVIPKGFSFDGMMPWACKTPLGRKEWRGQPRQEYIMTVDEMLKLQDVIPGSSMESLKTANVFRSVCHLFGDEKLTMTYEQKLSAHFTHIDSMRSFREQVLQIMESLMETYGEEGMPMQHFGTQQDVKKEVYRLTSLLVEQLSKLYLIFGQSSWQCVHEMRMKKILTEDGAKNLLAALSITTELRLKCYQRQGRQKEALPTVPQQSVTEDKDIPCPLSTAIVRLYQSLIPLKSVVFQILEIYKNHDLNEPETLVAALLQQANFMDVSPLTTAAAYLRVLQLPKAFDCLLSAKGGIMDNASRVRILLVLANCYKMVGKFHEAIECCREVETLYTGAPHVVETNSLLDALKMIMDIYIDQGLFQEAVQMYKQIVDFHERQDLNESFVKDELDFLNSSAVLFMNIKQYNKAEGILRSIIEMLRNQRKHYFSYFMCLNNLAVVLLNADNLAGAKTILNDALEIASELYGENAVHPYFARCLTNLSEVHYYLQNIQEADRLLHLALIIYSHVHEHELIDPGIIEALIIKAQICQFYEQWDEMFNALNKANEISKILYKGCPHTTAASILFYLGICEQERGKFSEALSHYQEYLKIYENVRMECQQSGHGCNTANVLIHIANVGEHCSYDVSYCLSCVEKALEIEKKRHGKESNHRHLAICFGTLGYLLIKEKRESKGLEYLGKAMEMLEEINFRDDKVFGHAHLTIGELLGEQYPNKAEKHLRTAEAVLKKTLKNSNHFALLQINSSLLKIFLHTSRIEDGLKLAKQQRRLIDTMLSKPSVPNAGQLCQVVYLGEFYEASGRRNTAKDMYIDVIARLEEQVDPTDSEQDYLMPLLWKIQQQLGEIFRLDGMFCDAEAMLQRVALSVKKTSSQRELKVKALKAHHETLLQLATIFMETGRHEQAYELLGGLINMYEEDPKSIDTYTASGAFLMRGELNRQRFRFNPALHDLEKALKIAETFRGTQDSEIYAKIENGIGLIYEQSNKPERAREYYLCCINTVAGIPPTMHTGIFHQNLADTLKKLGRLDDALVHYKKSLEIREMLFSEDPVREDIATVLYHIALVQYTDKRPKDASETLDKLISLRRELLKKGGSLQNYCAVFVLKGNCHIFAPGEAQQAKDAYEEAEKALKIMTEGQPNLDYAGVLSNLGE
jgi:tetratricopeptide (TPR) repeat protein